LRSTGREGLEKISRIFFLASGIFLAVSFALLLSAFLNNEFQYTYVYNNSSSELPLLYLISGVWAGKEGSFLLWALFINIMGFIVIKTREDDEDILMTVITCVQIFFVFLIVFDSPFGFIWESYENVKTGFIPADGAGLNPLLIDPWMVIHPPVLFLGYASAAVPFAYAVTALIKRDTSKWLKGAYPWLLFSMVTLGLGIFLGGYWAYKVLGWGGYWGWDPVENSSLIPWIIAVAFMHSMLIQKRKGSLGRTNFFLAIVYFTLVLYSTFLTRSGVLSDFSVHSFSEYSMSGILLFGLVLFAFAGLFLFAWRFKSFKSVELDNNIRTWENLTSFGILTLVIFALIILIGTSMPILSGALMNTPTAVTENFYNRTSIPFGVIIIVLICVSTLAVSSKKLVTPVRIAVVFIAGALSVLINIFKTKDPVAIIFLWLSIILIIQTLYFLFRKRKALLVSSLTHLGVGIMVAGIIISGYHSASVQKRIFQGKEEKVGSVHITFAGFEKSQKDKIKLDVRKGSEVKHIKADYYFDDRTNSLYREPYINSGIAGDIYIIPDAFMTGKESIMVWSSLKKGVPQMVEGNNMKFISFRTSGMMSANPVVYADILVNGKKVTPGIRMKDKKSMDKKIPGTQSTISLKGFNIGAKTVEISMLPGKKAALPPDSISVDVTEKSFIWLVWAGTVLITIGGIIGLVMAVKRNNRAKEINNG